MNVQVTSSGKSMAEKFFDHDIIHSGFEQPRCKGMPQVMEEEFMRPCPFNRFEPPMLEGVRVLPPPKEPTTNPWQITSQCRTGEVIEWNGLRNAFVGAPSRRRGEPQPISPLTGQYWTVWLNRRSLSRSLGTMAAEETSLYSRGARVGITFLLW